MIKKGFSGLFEVLCLHRWLPRVAGHAGRCFAELGAAAPNLPHFSGLQA